MAATALVVGCDGVLVHKSGGHAASRRAAHAAAWREACASVGLVWRDQDFERLAGVPAADAFARLAAEQGVAGIDFAAAARAKALAQRRLSSGEPFAPAVAFVRDAAGAGAAVALAAAVRRDHAAAVLAKTGLAALVRAVVSREAAPDAASRLLAAAVALGTPLASCHVLAADDETLAAAMQAGCAGATDARALPGYAQAAAVAAGPPEPPPPPRLKGVVKSYMPKTQYGFITPDGGGADIYVHNVDICRPPPRHLVVGERVEYWTEARAQGRLRARKVTAEGQPPWKDGGKKKKKKSKSKGGSTGGAEGRALGAAAAAQRTGAAAAAPTAADEDDESDWESNGDDGMETDEL